MQAFCNVPTGRHRNRCPTQFLLPALLGRPLLERKRFVRRVLYMYVSQLLEHGHVRSVRVPLEFNCTYPKNVGRPEMHLPVSSKPSLDGTLFRVHAVGTWWTLCAATTVSTCRMKSFLYTVGTRVKHVRIQGKD